MVKRNARSGPARRSERTTKKTVRSGESVSSSLKRRADTAVASPVTPAKPPAKQAAKKTAGKKAAVKNKVAKKAPKKSSTAKKTQITKKNSVTKQTAKPVKKAVGRKSLGAAPVAAGKAVAGAIMLEQVDGWNVVDVADGIAVHDSSFTGVHYLNHTAAAMYLLCKEPISLLVMSTILREEFGLDRDPGSEIEKTVEEMIRIGLIRKAGRRK